MSDLPPCDLCGRSIPCGTGYILRIEVFADPQTPALTADDVAKADLNSTLAGLMKQIQSMSAEELQDGVHRDFNYRLCSHCHASYLSNPLGKPRHRPISTN